MSMFGTIYTGTTGLVSYSKGLGVVSNNVANMNTLGFKRSDLQFHDLFYNYELAHGGRDAFSLRQDGSGVGVGETTLNFSQGDLQQTGGETDVAIDGNGFFMLRDGGKTFYTRVGQFSVADDGYLVSAINGARIAGLNGKGALTDINIAGLAIYPGQATTQVRFADNLSSGASQHVIQDIAVFDRAGNEHRLTMTLTKNTLPTPRSWLAEVKDASGRIITQGQEIRFQANGTPDPIFNAFSFSFSAADVEPFGVSFFFGEPGSFDGATSFSGGTTSTLAAAGQDGYASGTKVKIGFDAAGVMKIDYSNGKTTEAGRLALAWTRDLQSMNQQGNGLFTATAEVAMNTGAPNTGTMGKIVGGNIEVSNVEISQEFTDLVVIQRGFQVCSQVVTIANEMIQQLLDSTGSRR